MINFDSNQHVNVDGYVIQKGRKVHKSTIEFVLNIIDRGLTEPTLKSAKGVTLGDISGEGLWLDAMDAEERSKAGLCLSWLVDHGYVPLVKLPYKRGNTLLYRLKPAH